MPEAILINRPLHLDKRLPIPSRKWQPLDLLYVGTFLKNNGLTVEIIDARALDYSVADIKRILAQKQPKIVLIASDPYDLYQCPSILMDSFYQTIEAVQQTPSVKHILAIGPQAAIFDQELLNKTALGYIIKGNNPIAAANLILDLSKNQLDDLAGKYANLSCKKIDGTVNIGVLQNLEDLDKLPIGDYSLLPMEKYSPRMEFFRPDNFSIMFTSCGCPYNCKFCFKELIGSKVNSMSLPRFKQELDVLVGEYFIKNIYFIDDFFTFDRERVKQICRIIKEENADIQWGCQTRPERVDEELLKIMKDSGCIYISYGIESGSQAIVSSSGKGLNLEEAAKNYKLTKKIGIEAHSNMMYGYPEETAKDFNQTIDLQIELNDFSFPCGLCFFPQTKYYNELLPGKSPEEARKISVDLGLSRLTRETIEAGLAKLVFFKRIREKKIDFKTFYFLLKYIFPALVKKTKQLIKK